jgi:hypothetical protein
MVFSHSLLHTVLDIPGEWGTVVHSEVIFSLRLAYVEGTTEPSAYTWLPHNNYPILTRLPNLF